MINSSARHPPTTQTTAMAEPEEVRMREGEEEEELPMLHKRVDLVYCGGACVSLP